MVRERNDDSARKMFHVSLAYLFAVFLALLIDLVL